jgi:MFS family permease
LDTDRAFAVDFPKGPALLLALALLLFTGSFFGNLSGPAWMSWMADFVPLKIRGKYFGLRMRIGTVVGLLSASIAGLVLDWWTLLRLTRRTRCSS